MGGGESSILTNVEFREALQYLQLDPTPQLCRQYFTAVDRGVHGGINFAEFQLAINMIISSLSLDVLCRMGFSRLEQAFIFVMHTLLFFCALMFVYFGTKAFDGLVGADGDTNSGAGLSIVLPKILLPTFCSGFAWLAQA